LAWDKIARFWASRGYICAYLYAESENNNPKRYPIPAELAVEAVSEEPPQNNESSTSPDATNTSVDSERILFIPE
jgi:hypothetical protein